MLNSYLFRCCRCSLADNWSIVFRDPRSLRSLYFSRCFFKYSSCFTGSALIRCSRFLCLSASDDVRLGSTFVILKKRQCFRSKYVHLETIGSNKSFYKVTMAVIGVMSKVYSVLNDV